MQSDDEGDARRGVGARGLRADAEEVRGERGGDRTLQGSVERVRAIGTTGAGGETFEGDRRDVREPGDGGGG